MALPIQVQKQADEAEALAKQLEGHLEEPAPTEPQVVPPAVNAGGQGGTQEGGNHPKSDDYEQKYRTLQGIFSANKAKLEQQVREREAQLQDLRRQVEELTAKQTKEPSVQFGTDEDRANFGDDFVALVERGVQARTQEYRQEISSLKSQLEQMGGRLQEVDQSVEVSRHAALLADMDTLVPGWREQNVNQEFLDWLQVVNPVFGMTHGDILNNAIAAHDSARAAEVFKAFPGYGRQKSPQKTLAQQVSPSRGHSGGSGPKGQRAFTESQVARFYDDWRRGLYTDDKAKAIEQEIEQAYASGRIVAG